jgi:CDGSH-type Zn-finger protein/uncharacterized Fe-S cluster protein YjdI
MKSKVRTYEAEDIGVHYDVKRCIHAERCVHGLPDVFDPDRRPWIDPTEASPDAIAEVIGRCPTGALHFTRTDGGAPEAVPDENTVTLNNDGPLYVRGDVTIVTPDGTEVLRDTRVALCRCGKTENKPLCDNSHRDGFSAPGTLGTGGVKNGAREGGLRITLSQNGPLLLEGPVTIIDAEGQEHRSGSKAALCRCGGSQNKPFCDGTHKKNGFQSN